jgi:tRNA(adenine34) deaminase
MILDLRSIPANNDDERFMLEALKEAIKAYEKDEVPIGAVLVHEGRVIARGHNQVEMLRDATAHAEMLCMTAASSAMDSWRLIDTTLYCTVEPCSMCAGAMLLSRVKTLVWGAPDIRHGANGSWIDIFATEHPTHNVEIRRGILQEYSSFLLKSFFQKQRKNKG